LRVIVRVGFRAPEAHLYLRFGAALYAQIQAVVVRYPYPYVGVGGEFIARAPACFAGIFGIFYYKTYSRSRLRVIVDPRGLFNLLVDRADAEIKFGPVRLKVDPYQLRFHPAHVIGIVAGKSVEPVVAIRQEAGIKGICRIRSGDVRIIIRSQESAS